jgi:hypothetical protein
MVSCTLYDKEQDTAEFYADTKGELVNLPNLNESGKGELVNINSVHAGSTCLLPTGEVYVLTGSNTWEKLGG